MTEASTQSPERPNGARPVAVLSGAAQGIGYLVARELARTHRVALLDVEADEVRRAAAACGPDAIGVPCDIVRQDEVDRAIVDLLALRFGYMEAAARIKPSRDKVRDEARKADVLAKVDAAADEAGLDRALLARLYEELIEASIAYELEEFDRTRGG